MEEYELKLTIKVLIRHIQELTVELAAVLHDVSRYLPEETRDDIRSLTASGMNCRLLSDPYYESYIALECDGEDDLKDESYLDEVEDYLCDNDDDLFYPSYYSRKELQK